MQSGGFFLIRPYGEKTILKLKGNFDRRNALWVKKAMMASMSLRRNALELDMMDVDSIDMPAMSLITITLKALKDTGMETRITGLDHDKRTLAYSLGMQYITQIS